MNLLTQASKSFNTVNGNRVRAIVYQFLFMAGTSCVSIP